MLHAILRIFIFCITGIKYLKHKNQNPINKSLQKSFQFNFVVNKSYTFNLQLWVGCSCTLAECAQTDMFALCWKLSKALNATVNQVWIHRRFLIMLNSQQKKMYKTKNCEIYRKLEISVEDEGNMEAHSYYELWMRY